MPEQGGLVQVASQCQLVTRRPFTRWPSVLISALAIVREIVDLPEDRRRHRR
jgi:hypothetical protein